MSRKLILLTNDDGIDAAGLRVLENHIREFADCFVVAPAEECSATSHSVTLRSSLRVEKVFENGMFFGYKVFGKPSDCVKLALCELMEKQPDYIFSGINNGPNLGVSTFYSGTLAAAREGAIAGISSFAFSVTSHEVLDYESAASVSVKMFHKLIEKKHPEKVYFNINIPNVSEAALRGFKITKQADSYYEEIFTKGSFSNEKQSEYFLGGELLVSTEHGDNDVEVVRDGFVSVTPLKLDLTDEEHRLILKKEFGSTLL